MFKLPGSEQRISCTGRATDQQARWACRMKTVTSALVKEVPWGQTAIQGGTRKGSCQKAAPSATSQKKEDLVEQSGIIGRPTKQKDVKEYCALQLNGGRDAPKVKLPHSGCLSACSVGSK
eukprot:1158955-Pelagomonas_calceolata.AAC.5